MKKVTLMIVLVGLTVGTVSATTWFERKTKCPICKTTNKLQAIGSYGSYIYSWPEKFEYIYWPVTETYCLYTCKKCKYSAFMWDFSEMGKDTLKIIKNALPELKLPASKYSDNMTKKLESAELIYKLYNHNPDFWCKFYRIKGYHYEAEGNIEQAKIERLKALAIADSLLSVPDNDYRKKELLFITSSMKHFTNQDSESIKDIDLALSLTYNNPNIDQEKNSGFDSYLTRLLNELKMKIIGKENE